MPEPMQGITVRSCAYWQPIKEGIIALPCNCGMNCDGPRSRLPILTDEAAAVLRERDELSNDS
jgi:hypothetical protein